MEKASGIDDLIRCHAIKLICDAVEFFKDCFSFFYFWGGAWLFEGFVL
jgi:hypothetical protein